MKLGKPKVQRVYVSISDPVSGEKTHYTAYGLTGSEAKAALEGAQEAKRQKSESGK